jgi:hypothetical protein
MLQRELDEREYDIKDDQRYNEKMEIGILEIAFQEASH